jgi:pyridinium-3,5-bisthiocarboxylic acid mononucleotide nickel chelatase
MGSDRIIHFEPFSGISGDMFVGALLDLGVELEYVVQQLRKIPLGGYRLSAEKCLRAGIHATKFHVHMEHEHEHEPHSEHEMTYGHEHPHPPHDHGHGHSEEGGHHHHRQEEHEEHSHGGEHHHRTFSDIRKMIEDSGLSPWVVEKSTEAFRRLAEAEARIHNIEPEKVHFHEVGAIDSIVDIVGGMIAVETFLPARFSCSALNIGRGTVKCRHGIYPVPAPATEQLLRGIPTFSNQVSGELTTPTGAALIVTLVKDFSPRGSALTLGAGYGAGSRETPGNANVLRVTLAQELVRKNPGPEEEVAVIEASVDDMNPQIYGYFQEKALQEGALDVFATAIQMKKNRPGLLVTIVCPVAQVDAMAAIVFAETTTIGIRYTYSRRKTLERRFLSVQTEFGALTIKASYLEGRRVNFVPEYEDCRRAAAEQGVALKNVLAAANRAYLKLEEETRQP